MVSDDARTLLGRLAGVSSRENDADGPRPSTDYGETIRQATAALDDLDAAVAFVDDGGIGRLETAVERATADLSVRAAEGRETLDAYRELRNAAHGNGRKYPDEPTQ